MADYRDIATRLQYGASHAQPAYPETLVGVPSNVTDAAAIELVDRYARRLYNREPEETPPPVISWERLSAIMSDHRGG